MATAIEISFVQLQAPAPRKMGSGCDGQIATVIQPYGGKPAYCCVPPADEACRSSADPGGCSERPPVKMVPIPVGCGFQYAPECPMGAEVRTSYNVLSRVSEWVARWRREAGGGSAMLPAGPGLLNLASGNLVVNLKVPDAGAFDPTPTPFYNSLAPAASEFGRGWTAVPKQTLTSLTATSAQVTSGQGSVTTFTDRDVNDQYRNASGGTDALAFDPGSNTWTQTRSDGFRIVYDSGGRAARFSDVSGSRWTLSYDDGRLAGILAPTGGRTTLAYDGADFLRRVVQPGGRTTTFTVDGNGHLVRRVAADLAVTTLAYDAAHRLTAHTDPTGHRTSFGYDAASRVAWVEPPAVGRTTYLCRSAF